MDMPQSTLHPDQAAGTGATSDATTPAESRPPERRKSKFLEEGIIGEEKLALRSGEETETFDSVVNPPVRAPPQQVKEKHTPWLQPRRPEWKKQEPFAEEEGAKMRYKTMTWWQAAFVMAAEIISLGIFILPSSLSTLGIATGVVLIVVFGLLSTYTGYVFWRFKMAHPFIHNMADVGEMLGGGLVREVLGAAQIILLVFTMGRHILFFSTSFNKITSHAACTIIWAVIALALSTLVTIPRTLKTLSYTSIIALIAIIAAAFITMIATGNHPPPDVDIYATHDSTLATAFLGVTPIIFIYSAQVTMFAIISELRQPKDFPKALVASQGFAVIMYVLVAVVIYCNTSDAVSSLAIDNGTPLLQKVAHGFALPSILVAGAVYAHVAAKYVYVRVFRGTSHMHNATMWSAGSWVLIVVGLWLGAFVIAESIPDYGYLFALICAIFTSWFTYGLAGILWLFLHANELRVARKRAVLHVVIVLIAVAMMAMGVYSSGKAMHDDGGRRSWTCAVTASRIW